MTSRPILMSGPMVRAILAGTKTQTRRVIKPQPDFDTARARLGGDTSSAVPVYDPLFRSIGLRRGSGTGFTQPNIRSPYGAKMQGWSGDQLWVRETFGEIPEGGGTIVYRATDPEWGTECGLKWKPSIFMPRWASRITLEIESVRVERLQEISEEDAIAEGIESVAMPVSGDPGWKSYTGNGAFGPKFAIESYRTLWESINGPGSWDANPFVWVLSFRRIANREEGAE